MKKQMIFTSILFFLFLGVYGQENKPAPTDETNKADEFYNNATIIGFDVNVDPYDLLGALMYYKEDNKENWEYFSLLSLEEKESIDPAFQNVVFYQKVVDKEFVASAKYLGIFKAEVTKKHKLEVILEDVYNLNAPTFIESTKIKSLIDYYGKYLKEQGYTVKYIDKVNLSTLTSRLFKEDKQSVGISYIDGDGKNYNKETDFTLKKILSVHAVDMTYFIKTDDDKGLFNPLINIELPEIVTGVDYIPTLKKVTPEDIFKE